jgi:hypothetical protein
MDLRCPAICFVIELISRDSTSESINLLTREFSLFLPNMTSILVRSGPHSIIARLASFHKVESARLPCILNMIEVATRCNASTSDLRCSNDWVRSSAFPLIAMTDLETCAQRLATPQRDTAALTGSIGAFTQLGPFVDILFGRNNFPMGRI